MDYYLTENIPLCFMISSGICTTITLHVDTQIHTSVHIHALHDSQVTIRCLILFQDQIMLNLHTLLCGNNAHIKILGVIALHDQQKVSIKTEQKHIGKSSHSRLQFNSVVSGSAQFIYSGTICIEKDAAYTYASQYNKNILLSPASSAVSIPNIEVLHDNVQCYHGAAIGKFDKNQIQYMQSRGLDIKTIEQLLLYALFQEPLQGYYNKQQILETIYKNI